MRLVSKKERKLIAFPIKKKKIEASKEFGNSLRMSKEKERTLEKQFFYHKTTKRNKKPAVRKTKAFFKAG